MADHAHDHPGLSISVEHTDETTARVSFEVTREEFEKLRDRGLKNVSRRTRMKGFRPGKTPKQVVEKAYGEQIEKEVIEHWVNHAYQDALKAHDLKPAAHPRIDVAELKRGDDGRFSHSFEVLLRPTFELGTYKGLTVTTQPTEVTDEELEETMTQLRRQHARPEDAGDEPLAEEGMTVAKVTFVQEGAPEPVLERDGVRLAPTAPPSGIDPDEYKGAMVGAKAGDTVEVAITFPALFPVESARGATGTCRIELSEVYRIVEPDDQELATAVGMGESEDFLGEVRSRLAEAKAEQEDRRIETELIDQLLAAHPMTIPPAIVADQANVKVQELRNNLPEGLDEAEIESRLEAERVQAAETTERAMKALYLIEAIAQEEKLQVTNDDIRGELQAIAERNGAPLDDVRKYYHEQNLGQQLVMELLERKVRNLLRENADRQPAG